MKIFLEKRMVQKSEINTNFESIDDFYDAWIEEIEKKKLVNNQIPMQKYQNNIKS